MAVLARIGKTATALAVFIGFVAILFQKRIIAFVHTPFDLPESWHPFDGGSANVLFADTIKFAEDLIIDHDRGVAIVSSDAGRSQWNTVLGILENPDPKGNLYIYDYASTGSLKELELVDFPETSDFHPLGVDFFRSSPGASTRLFVVNHARTGSRVDIFDLDYKQHQAKYIRSISDDNKTIVSPNAVHPISYTQFYVTNDHLHTSANGRVLSMIETLFVRPLSWATFVDFSDPNELKCTVVAEGIPFANGIIVTPTGKEVLIASTTTSAVFVYERDAQTNLLSKTRETILTHFRTDNLAFDDSLDVSDPTAFDSEGRFLRGVIVGGHPSNIVLQLMARNPDKYNAPSWVAEIRRGTGVDPAPFPAGPEHPEGSFYSRTLYLSNGNHYASVCTGALDSKRGHMLASGLYGKGILDISWKV
ncbi:hypothetical protein FQN55_001932 [Onygenales sp. PD_40]|nr:hypothetical protein FQN55_001932 [Onygenales sp. PD_40]KAK2789612.1 hypothetical protein FQN52_005951 [Onygenales sp. PD_12]